jgi:hypothetical protein
VAGVADAVITAVELPKVDLDDDDGALSTLRILNGWNCTMLFVLCIACVCALSMLREASLLASRDETAARTHQNDLAWGWCLPLTSIQTHLTTGAWGSCIVIQGLSLLMLIAYGHGKLLSSVPLIATFAILYLTAAVYLVRMLIDIYRWGLACYRSAGTNVVQHVPVPVALEDPNIGPHTDAFMPAIPLSPAHDDNNG